MNTISQNYGVRLTARENQILYCLSIGLSTKEIAEHLFISENTVANHRKSLLRKRGARTCKDLIMNPHKYKLFCEIKNSHL
jgi:DNA-binding CsgD family transcriptional regulator